jgi:hypothetical protein
VSFVVDEDCIFMSLGTTEASSAFRAEFQLKPISANDISQQPQG